MIRLFLDSNVLFTAAHNPEGKASFLIELGRAGRWDVVTSAYCVAEARLNLEQKYPACVIRLEEMLRAIRQVSDVAADHCVLELPEKDRPVFGAAQRCRATHFLTGDQRHFGPYMNKPKQTKGIVVQTVTDFLFSISK